MSSSGDARQCKKLSSWHFITAPPKSWYWFYRLKGVGRRKAHSYMLSVMLLLLSWAADYVARFTCPRVTHPSANMARCRVTSLVETDAIHEPNRQPLQSTVRMFSLRTLRSVRHGGRREIEGYLATSRQYGNALQGVRATKYRRSTGIGRLLRRIDQLRM